MLWTVGSLCTRLGQESGSRWGSLSLSLFAPNVDPVNWGLGSAQLGGSGSASVMCRADLAGREVLFRARFFLSLFPKSPVAWVGIPCPPAWLRCAGSGGNQEGDLDGAVM